MRDPALGEIETWTEVADVRGDVVVTTQHYRFAATGERITAQSALRFRTADDVDRSLLNAGFVTEHRYGGWDRRPFTEHDDEIVVVSRAVV